MLRDQVSTIERAEFAEPKTEEQIQREKLRDELITRLKNTDVYRDKRQDLIKQAKSNSGIPGGAVGLTAGVLFEEMAMTYYYEILQDGVEKRYLADFIHGLLVCHEARSVNFYDDQNILLTEARILPGIEVLGNPDGLVVNIVDTPEGKRVDVVGVLDAKFGGKLDPKQTYKFFKSIHRTIDAILPLYTQLRLELDLDFLPEMIGIARGKLKAGVLKPMGDNDGEYTKDLSRQKDIVIPVTYEEVKHLVDELVEEVERST